ncbi:MAG: hypothetical protein ABI680_20935 [Chthoniobacteraceae bacterium]
MKLGAAIFSSTFIRRFDTITAMNGYRIQGRWDYCSGDVDGSVSMAGKTCAGAMSERNPLSFDRRIIDENGRMIVVRTELSFPAPHPIARSPA